MIRQPLLLALLGGLLCASPWLEAAGPGQMPALVLEQFVDGQWQTPNRVVAWGRSAHDHNQAKVPAELGNIVAIAAGGFHTTALKSDGSVVAWGDNSSNQCTVPSGLANVVAIAAGDLHTVALKRDGTVVAWGDNSYKKATVPAGLGDVVAISAGISHTAALKSDGTVVSWGDNGYKQPTVRTGLSNVVAISAGGYNTAALRTDGSVVIWGYNYFGQTQVPVGLGNAVAIAIGGYHTAALRTDGSVVAWGYNGHEQASVPEGLSNVVAISAGVFHTVALKSNGSVVAWGSSSFGKTTVPTGLSNVVSISAGGFHTVALASFVDLENTTIGSSTNVTLRLTNPSTSHSLTGLRLDLPISTGGLFSLVSPLPTTLAPGASTQITVSYAPHTAGATSGKLQIWADGSNIPLVTTTLQVGLAQVSLLDGMGQPITAQARNRVVAWGDNLSNQTTVPTNLGDVIAISAGGYHTAALKSDGSVVAWGSNGYCQATVPEGLSNVMAIATGFAHTVALKKSGTIVAWGDNGSKQTTVPTGLSHVVAISAGGAHKAALRSDGRVIAWGYNDSGQTKVPVGLSDVAAIAAGERHTVALKGDGTVVAWGSDFGGQIQVPLGLSGGVAIVAGYNHTMALSGDGDVVAWGDTFYGKTTYGLAIVPPSLRNVVAMSAGGNHSVALKSDGSLVTWGSNNYGQTTVPDGLSGVIAIAAGAYHTVALVEASNDFSLFKPGLHRNHSFLIKDTGAITLRGVSIVIEGPDADQFSLPDSLPSSVATGEQAPFTLRFSPTRFGPLNATLKIHSNAPDSPYILPIKGTGNFDLKATNSSFYGSPFAYAPLRLERATGLMLQRISFTNTTGVSLQGLQLVLSNLASGVTLYSSSAGKALGTFDVLYTKSIAPGEAVTFDLVYHDPKRRATASIQPMIKAQALEQAVPTPGPVTGTNVPLLRVQKLAQGPALEWNSKAGSTYVVEYSDDAGKTWSSAVHRLTSRGTRLFWIDRGQPETFSAPIVGTRSYRVKRL